MTVVIPCHNYGRYVVEAIESALSQRLPPARIIVIDDGSTDDSREVLGRYERHPLVEIIHQENAGVVAAKNRGLAAVDTTWTVFLDADDALMDTYTERVVELANRGRYDLVYTDMQLFGARDAVAQARPFRLFTLLSENYIHNSALVRTSLVKRVGGYREAMRDGLEDWDLYLSLVEVGARLAYLPEALLRYRQHGDALSRNVEATARKEELIRILVSLHPDLFDSMGPLRRRLLTVLQEVFWLLRYPGGWWIALRSARRAAREGPRVIRNAVRTYIARKELGDGAGHGR